MSKTLFFNAKVYVEKGCFAQAVYQEDGWIKAVGTNEEVKAAAAPDAEMVDCGGKTIVPGFNDSHMHVLQFGEVLNEPYIKGCRSVEEMVEICKKFAADHPDMVKNGMHGQGWNQDLFDEGKVRLPNRYDLDRISTDYPIMLERVCAHTCVLNSKALELLGIDRNTPVDVFPGGTVEKDEKGEPTGYVTENALYEVRHVVPDPDAEGIQKNRGLVKEAIDAVSADMIVNPQVNTSAAFAGAGNMTAAIDSNSSVLTPILDAINQLKGNGEGGDIIVPVYIGQDRIDEIVVTAAQRANYRSGGR